MKLAPTVFFGHGSPMTVLDRGEYAEALAAFGRRIASARAIILLSAHWETSRALALTASDSAPILHDFGGFPPNLYRIEYPAPGSPEIAEEAAQRLRDAGFSPSFDDNRGLDHGAWVPLALALPDAQIPVVQLSLPHLAPPSHVLALGAALQPLRHSGIVLAASGDVTHNLRLAFRNPLDAEPEPWAVEFDDWILAQLEGRRVSTLLEYETQAPHAALAVPTLEHFTPLFFTLGASRPGDTFLPLFRGMEHGNISMSSYAFGL